MKVRGEMKNGVWEATKNYLFFYFYSVPRVPAGYLCPAGYAGTRVAGYGYPAGY